MLMSPRCNFEDLTEFFGNSFGNSLSIAWDSLGLISFEGVGALALSLHKTCNADLCKAWASYCHDQLFLHTTTQGKKAGKTFTSIT
jgi:hypothetical protein